MVTIHEDGEPENVVEIGYKSKAIEGLLDEFRVDLEDAKEAVNKKLHARALFSLDQSRAENPRYPTFAGDAGQDFVKLKERTEYRFRRNQVAKKNQLKKLRETLKALRLIPGITGDIGYTCEIMKDAFGDATRILQQSLETWWKMLASEI